MNYAIVDIETTGRANKITEIAIFVHDGTQVVDEFTTLVNPECSIPPFITHLTGITNAMVSDAPKFYEIAKKVNELTLDTIFVAHSVNFDYGILQQEFKSLGFDFKRKKLCTIRLSRKLIPGLHSYSLGTICSSQHIRIENRHRARGDAQATTLLFEKLHLLDTDGVFNSFLHPRSRQATLPPLLPQAVFDALPEKTGIYYFKNIKNDVIYVGKANNIKQRVLSHFYDKASKEITMCLETSNVTFEETGSELVALLMESAEIKRLFPKYNRSQRRAQESLGLFSYTDRHGIMHLAYNRLKLIPNPLLKFYNVSEARAFLEKLCQDFELCPKYCHLQTNVSSCFHYQIKQCKGICSGNEAVEVYNERVQLAIDSMRFNAENFIIRENGRTAKEYAYIVIENGIYKGYGYAGTRKKFKSMQAYLEVIDPHHDNNDIKRILKSYLKFNRENLITFDH